MPSLVLTLIGVDRPGLVESVAKIICDQKGNWLESRMAHLAGQFAGIVRVDVAEEHADHLVESLQRLDEVGLKVIALKDATPATHDDVSLIHLDLVGNDRPGIVSEVSHVLAELNVNVEEFQTECREAANSGSTLFRATAELRLPSSLSIDRLQAALEDIALDLMVDIQLAEPVPGDA